MEQNDLEFLIPSYSDLYIDLDMKFSFRGELVSCAGKDVDLIDSTAVASNVLHSMFSQCNAIPNGVALTQSSEH